LADARPWFFRPLGPQSVVDMKDRLLHQESRAHQARPPCLMGPLPERIGLDGSPGPSSDRVESSEPETKIDSTGWGGFPSLGGNLFFYATWGPHSHFLS